MDNFFKAIKVIAYIISKIIAFHFSLFLLLPFAFTETPTGFTFILGLTLIRIICTIIFCIPTMITVKINDYSSWWVVADIVVAGLFFFCCIG